MSMKDWVRVGPGKLELTTWISDSHVTYSALWEDSGWVLTRRVAGADVPLIVTRDERDFSALHNLVDEDKRRGL